MIIAHRSDEKKICMERGFGGLNSGAVLFFVPTQHDTIEEMDNEDIANIAMHSYSPGGSDCPHLHVLEIESIIHVSALEIDDQSRKEINKLLDYYSNDDGNMPVPGDHDHERPAPEDVLDGSEERLIDNFGDLSWEVQRIRAEVARRAGYDAVEDRDENGDVMIVDFTIEDDRDGHQLIYLGIARELEGYELESA